MNTTRTLALIALAFVAAAVAGCNPYALGDACTDDLGCNLGEHCDLENEVCVGDDGTSCNTDQDCALFDPNTDCNETTHTCQAPGTTECTVNADCGEGNHCDDDGVCQDGCESNADCDTTGPDYCEVSSGDCLPGCANEGDCEADENCDLSNAIGGIGHCVNDGGNTGCTDNSDCDPNNDNFCCDDGIDCTLGECFDFCTSNDSCVAKGLGNSCNLANGQCSTVNPPTTCTSDIECISQFGADFICDPANAAPGSFGCVQTSSSTDPNCSPTGAGFCSADGQYCFGENGVGTCPYTTLQDPYCDQNGLTKDCNGLGIDGSTCGTESNRPFVCSGVINAKGCGIYDGTPFEDYINDPSVNGHVCGAGHYCSGTGDPATACDNQTTAADPTCDDDADCQQIPNSNKDHCLRDQFGGTCIQ